MDARRGAACLAPRGVVAGGRPGPPSLSRWYPRAPCSVGRRRPAATGGAELYGRYWGADAAPPFLYFALCLYRPIAHAIERGLARVHAGRGRPSTSMHARGFAPTPIASLHRVGDPRLQQAIGVLSAAEAAEARHLLTALPGPGR